MKRLRQTPEAPNTDRWLLTYSDLITLLLGLFVILYAMSKIDNQKYSQIVNALGGVFGNAGRTTPAEKFSPVELERKRIEGEIRNVLQLDKTSLPVFITNDERGVTIHLLEELLFESGRADLKQTSRSTLDALAGVLGRLPNDIRVEGHTDNVPISTPQFPSNWHLSVARAVNTGYYLIQRHQLNPEKVSVVGYAEYQPLAPDRGDANRAANRRVDIVVVTNTPTGHSHQPVVPPILKEVQ